MLRGAGGGAVVSGGGVVWWVVVSASGRAGCERFVGDGSG